jgi:diaminopropionate ammonia-lyase
LGAKTIRVAGNYDDAHAKAEEESKQSGWFFVGDAHSRESVDVPRHILHGYSVLASELLDAWESESPPTHLFVPAGSGLLAAAITAALMLEYGAQRPRVIVVQPHAADALLQSVTAQRRVPAKGDLSTLMDGLSVRDVSQIAWTLLQTSLYACVTISDYAAMQGLAAVANPSDSDPLLQVGETGIAALAGLLAVALHQPARERLELAESSRVAVIASEGISDPVTLGKLTTESGSKSSDTRGDWTGPFSP